MQPTIESLQRSVRRLQAYAGLLSVAVLVAAVSAFRTHESDVLRVRGIIVEDDAGRERILIGAPIPPPRSLQLFSL